MVDADKRLVDIAFTLAVEVEGSGLGGFEGVVRSVGVYLSRDRLDFGKDRRLGVDSEYLVQGVRSCFQRHRSETVPVVELPVS